MKRIISMMLAIALVFTLSACSKNNTSSDIDSSTPTQVETFSAPENYASVLLVTINPQFKLYLDENNNVLAVEPVNDDAKTFSDEIDFENKSFESVIEIILEKANEKGFVKENATVNFEITEQKAETVSKDDILQKAVAAAQQKATELKITITAEAKETEDNASSKETSTTSGNTSTSSTDKPSSSASKPTTSSQSKTSKSTHTHSFSAATCTTPQKCSCGATNGLALGHKWQEATCKAPKTCSVCKATDGNIGNHKYTNGECIYCGDKQIINPKTGLKENADYYYVRADGDGNYTLIIWQFDGTIICPKSPAGVFSTNEQYKDRDDTVTYKGKTYYGMGSGGPLPEYTLTDTEIILKFSEEEYGPEYANIEYRLIVNYEYDLEVTYSSDGAMFKKSDILDLVE